jgi:hypothetical protein
LSAVPSPFVSVNFQTSSAFDSFVRIVSWPKGITKRGKHSLSTKDLVRLVDAVVVLSSCSEIRPTGASSPLASASCM